MNVAALIRRTLHVGMAMFTVLFGALACAAGAQAQEFKLEGFRAGLHAPAVYASNAEPPAFDALTPATEAGSHPDMSVEFSVTNDIAAIRDVDVDLPAGFYGNPQAAPTCDIGAFTYNAPPPCPPETQVGVIHIRADAGALFTPFPVYNLPAADDETAIFGFIIGGVPVKILIDVRTDDAHQLRARVLNVNESVPINKQRLTIWGDPADPVHDAQRFGPGSNTPGRPSTAPRRPFLTAPPRCDSPLTTSVRIRTWQGSVVRTAQDSQPALTGCDQLAFTPSITVTPRDLQADAPAGYDVTVDVPQETEDPAERSTPHLKKAVVTLPEGVAISPPSATGLEGCAAADTAIGTLGEPKCPEASKIGTVKITTPVLEDPLEGEIVLRSPEPGKLFRLLLVARGPGLVVKLPGEVLPDPKTGRITAVFENTPQLPFSKLELSFKGGSRAPLVNPRTCGTKTTTTEFTPWGGPTATPTSSFEITGCTGGFAPSFEAGMVNPLAGSFSPFTMTIRRADGTEDIGSIALDMPPGLLGMVASVPQCPEVQAAAGTCGEQSRVGTTTVESGSGEHPFPLSGKVFLAGPYKGAPFSLAIVVRAVAGPFDLGTVVVRAPINVDAAAAKIGVPSDPLPTILEGVPLRLKTINITIDRAGFMFNPTNCDQMGIGARIGSSAGTVVTRSVPFRAQNCARLPLQPELSLTLRGPKEVKDGKHPQLDANLTQAPGESGLKKVAVTLPLSLALESTNAQALCKPQEAAARACPAGSIVGRATAITPALSQPLSGPVYFVENTRTTTTGSVRRTLPRLWLALQGEVPLDLWADSTIDDDHLVATFSMVPDAPISAFRLSIAGGEHGILAATENICEKHQIAAVTFEGQSGKRVSRDISMGSECGYRVAKATRSKTSVTVTVSGLGAGKLEVSGKGLRKTSRTIKQATIARATAKLSSSSLRALRREGRLVTRVSVKFTPADGGKPRTTGAKVTFKR